MTQYKLQPFGVLDCETGAHIPEDSRNLDWQEYQAWLADGHQPEPYMSDAELLSEAKEKKLNAIKDRLEELLTAGLEYPVGSGQYVQIREKDTSNITGAVVRASLAAQIGDWPEDFAWILADNSTLPLSTPQDMIALGTAAFAEVTRLRLVTRRKKDEVAVLSTIEDIEQYDIEAGWSQ